MKNTFDAYLWDVGHGLSLTVITPYVLRAGDTLIMRERVLQFDAKANTDTGFSPILHLYDNWGITVFDCFSISHHDKDHIDDLPNALDLQEQGLIEVLSLLRNKTIPYDFISEDPKSEGSPKKAFRHYHSTYKHPVPAWKSLRSENYGGVEVKSTYLEYFPGLSVNNSSTFVVINFGKTQIIVPGDIEPEGYDLLKKQTNLPNPNFSSIRILIAPHHGRESAYIPELLADYRPNIVLASAVSEDEHTDSRYSRNSAISGYPIIKDNLPNLISHRFHSTKGKMFHISAESMLYPEIRHLSIF